MSAVTKPAAQEVAETFTKAADEDHGDKSLDEFPPDSTSYMPTTEKIAIDSHNAEPHHSERPGGLKGLDEDDDVAPPAGFFESDFFQRIVVTISVLVAVYSAVMAALLAIFVPQHCCPNVSHSCSIESIRMKD